MLKVRKITFEKKEKDCYFALDKKKKELKRKFFTNLILLLTVNGLVKPFWLFGIDRKVQIVTGDDYGLYLSLYALSITFNVLLDMGIANYNNRNIARYNHLLPKHLSNILGLKMLLFVAYSAILFIWAGLVGYNNIQFHLLLFLIINQFLLQLILYLRSNLSALHLFTTDSLVSVLDRIFMIAFCGILLYTNLYHGPFRIEWFVYIQTVSYILATLIIFIIVIKKSGKIKLNFNLRFNLVFLKKTYPYAILILLMSFYNRFDQVLIERLLPGEGLHQVAIYAHGFRLLDAASMFGVLFAGMLLPIFSRMIKMKQQVGDMVKFSFSLIIFISLTLAVTSFFYQVEIMEWMYDDDVLASAPIFSILMFCFVPISTTYIVGTLLTANGSIKQLNIMAGFGMAFNLLLNLFIIPKYQALGAAYVGLFTQTFTALAQVVIAFHLFKLKTNWVLIGQITLFALLLVVSGYVCHKLFPPLSGILVMLAFSTLIAFFIRLIDLKNLVNIVMNRE
jgi:O-antigen/teichoic acid export membrane protein